MKMGILFKQIIHFLNLCSFVFRVQLLFIILYFKFENVNLGYCVLPTAYLTTVSRDNMQRRSRLCCGKRREKKVSQVPRHHLCRWFRAGGHRNVWCMGQTSHWSDQGDRLSNLRHHVWQSSYFIPSTAPINRRSARKRHLRSWDTVQSARCRRVGLYQWQIEHVDEW